MDDKYVSVQGSFTQYLSEYEFTYTGNVDPSGTVVIDVKEYPNGCKIRFSLEADVNNHGLVFQDPAFEWDTQPVPGSNVVVSRVDGTELRLNDPCTTQKGTYDFRFLVQDEAGLHLGKSKDPSVVHKGDPPLPTFSKSLRRRVAGLIRARRSRV